MSGNWTRVICVTGRYTHHYTNTEIVCKREQQSNPNARTTIKSKLITNKQKTMSRIIERQKFPPPGKDMHYCCMNSIGLKTPWHDVTLCHAMSHLTVPLEKCEYCCMNSIGLKTPWHDVTLCHAMTLSFEKCEYLTEMYTKIIAPLMRFELTIFALGGRRLIH